MIYYNMNNMKKINFKNVVAYIQGNFRYRLYYSAYFGWLMRTHIREQIDARIDSMDRICHSNGSCKMCGCMTTQLQMANKECDKPCYPAMMSRHIWMQMKAGFMLRFKNGTWTLEDGRFIKI